MPKANAFLPDLGAAGHDGRHGRCLEDACPG